MADSTNMNLTNDITVNGVTYRAGQNVIVPAKQADDIARMDYEHNKYLQNLNKKNSYIVDAGNIAVGSGAE